MLRLIKLCLVAGLVAALPILAQALSGQALNWATVGRTALAAFSVAALGALLKWVTAQGDAPLQAPLGPIAQVNVPSVFAPVGGTGTTITYKVPDTSAPPAVPGGTTSGA